MKFTEKNSLNVESHSQIDFINIRLDKDIKLFIDPYLIETTESKFCIDSQILIRDFFIKLYKLYEMNANDETKIKFLNHAHEINATKLGYGNGDNGRGSEANELLRIFNQFKDFFEDNVEFSKINYLPIFLRGFAEDHLSDMLTNILFFKLNEFTILQCKKLKIELSDKTDKDYYFWSTEYGWTKYNGKCLLMDNKLILLVPKNIIVNKYPFSARDFFTKVISNTIQEERIKIINGKSSKPTKKRIKKEMKEENISELDKDIEYYKKDPTILEDYNQKLLDLYRLGKFNLSDTFLDNFVDM